jgi:fatty-acyl-CoA synthase
MYLGISHWLRRWAARRPEQEAIVFEGERVTYGELDARVDAVARGLQGLGVRPGDRVAVLAPNRVEFLELFWACARAGAVFAPLNTRLTAVELVDIVADLDPAVVCADARLVERLAVARDEGAAGGVLAWVGLDEGDPSPTVPELRAAGGAGAGAVRVPAVPDDTVAILYTSGTTGRSKGAMITHANVESQAAGWVQAFNTGGDDRHLLMLPLCFTGGLMGGAMNPVFSGATIVLQEGFDAAACIAAVGSERVTWLTAVPTMVERILRHPDATPANLPTLRRLETGGAPIPVPLVERAAELGIGILQGYGLTECTAGPALFLDAADAARKPGSTGKASLNADVRLVTADGRDAEVDEVGEILIAGGTVFKGYWRNDDATRETLVDGWLHTGDLARRDADGDHYVVGRSKELIISGGLNVYPAEVEAALRRVPGVVETAVAGVPDETWGEVVTAWVIADDPSLTEAAVIAACRELLADYKRPKRVLFVEDFPRTAAGKVRKHELRVEEAAA